MKLVLTILLIVIALIIWARFFPNKEITIRAESIRNLSGFTYQKLKIWSNNRLQTHRLRQSLVQREIMLAHSQQLPILSNNSELYELTAKAFKRTVIFQKNHKTNIVIPTESSVLTNFAKKELDDCLLELLMTYYPDHHWQPLKTKRVPITNYFYLIIKEK